MAVFADEKEHLCTTTWLGTHVVRKSHPGSGPQSWVMQAVADAGALSIELI